MNDKNLKKLIQECTGDRVGRGSILPPEQVTLFPKPITEGLENQWSDSGRDRSKIYARIVETSGSELYLTGWDGKDTYIGYESDKGLDYIPASRIRLGASDPDWNTEITLGEVRQTLDEMDRHKVNELLSGLRKNVTKRQKSRRCNEAKNFINRFISINAAPVDQMEEVKKPKKVKFSVETPGNTVKPVKGEAFESAMSKFKRLSEASSSKDPSLTGLASKVAEYKQAQKMKKDLPQNDRIPSDLETLETPEDDTNA